MENAHIRESNPLIKEADQELDHCHELLGSLSKEKGWTCPHLYQHQGFWIYPCIIPKIMSFQQHFQAQDTDLILVSVPKSGTMWLKALMFAIANSERYANSQHHPLLTSNPHDLVPFVEIKLYANKDCLPDHSNLSSPRLFATHIPYHSLPESITNSDCRVVYLCRNPFDTFISSWHFYSKPRPTHLEPLSLTDALDMYCRGVVNFGPFWDHVLAYWKESLVRPNKILFLMCEDLKEDIILHMKRLAEFIGVPFSPEEERKGVIEEISRLCSFSNLKELKVNKTGRTLSIMENKSLFWKAEVGDWVNHLTPEMVKRLNEVIKEKLGGSGLTFKTGL